MERYKGGLNMSNLIITASGDVMDEFDFEGFAIFNKEDWEKVKEGIPEGEFEAYFGSNEFIVFGGKRDYLSHLIEKEISDEELTTLFTLLGLGRVKVPFTYGLFVIKSSNY